MENRGSGRFIFIQRRMDISCLLTIVDGNIIPREKSFRSIEYEQGKYFKIILIWISIRK